MELLKPIYNIEMLLKNSIHFESLPKFIYKSGISGRLSGQVINQKIITEIINDYQSDVNKILIKIEVNNEDSFIILINQNSSIRLFSNEDDYNYNLNILNTLIF